MAIEWEYHVEISSTPLDGQQLGEFGHLGWELVDHKVEPGRTNIVSFLLGVDLDESSLPKHIYTFKRPKREA